MNWHICKLILAFLHWSWLPAFWADAFYASGKQRRSAPQGLCTTALWGKRRERGFLKLLLRQGGILAWGQREETVLLSLNASGIFFVILLYWSTPDGASWGPRILLPLCFQHPLTKKNSLFPLPIGFPFHISLERRNFQLHGSGKDDDFNLWIVSYQIYLRFQAKVKPDIPGNKSNILLWGDVQLETLLWSPLKSEPGGSSRDVLLSHLEKDRGWITMRHSLLWHKLQLYQE